MTRLQTYIEKGTIWLLRRHAPNIDLNELVTTYKDSMSEVSQKLETLVGKTDLQYLKEREERLQNASLPTELVTASAILRYRYYILDIIVIAGKMQAVCYRYRSCLLCLRGTFNITMATCPTSLIA